MSPSEKESAFFNGMTINHDQYVEYSPEMPQYSRKRKRSQLCYFLYSSSPIFNCCVNYNLYRDQVFGSTKKRKLNPIINLCSDSESEQFQNNNVWKYYLFLSQLFILQKCFFFTKRNNEI